MKRGVIIYHSNIKKIYSDRWVNKSLESMLNQTENDFIFYELNYGDDHTSLVSNTNKNKVNFWSQKLSNYAEAMNILLDNAFNDGCDYVFNTNLDDYYSPDRILLQTKMIKENDLDIVSSDFCYIEEQNRPEEEDVITLYKNIVTPYIKENLEAGHNVIAHPSVCYNKRFWEDKENRYDINKTPKEDLDLWVRSIRRGYKFGIHKDLLLYYRIHKNQASNK
jgi:hypothetical protein